MSVDTRVITSEQIVRLMDVITYNDLASYLNGFNIGLLRLKMIGTVGELPSYVNSMSFVAPEDYGVTPANTWFIHGGSTTTAVPLFDLEWQGSYDRMVLHIRNDLRSEISSTLRKMSQLAVRDMGQKLLEMAMDKYREGPCKVYAFLPSELQFHATDDMMSFKTLINIWGRFGICSIKEKDDCGLIEEVKYHVEDSEDSTNMDFGKSIFDTIMEDIGEF